MNMENNNNIVDEQTTVTTQTTTEPVAGQEGTQGPATPYKVFNSEDEYKKEVQSLSSKAKYELLKELNAKSLDDIRSKFSELEAVKNELSALNDIKSELEATRKEKELLSDTLLAIKAGAKQETLDDFLTLAKKKVNDEVNLEQAMKLVLDTYKEFRAEDLGSITNRIGTEKGQKPTNRDYIMDLTKL
jgi:hypothetical protein